MKEKNESIDERHVDLSYLADKWPSNIVSRCKVSDFSGGLLDQRSMANIDCLGKGPERVRIGRKVGYPVGALIRWMEARASRPDKR